MILDNHLTMDQTDLDQTPTWLEVSNQHPRTAANLEMDSVPPTNGTRVITFLQEPPTLPPASPASQHSPLK